MQLTLSSLEGNNALLRIANALSFSGSSSSAASQSLMAPCPHDHALSTTGTFVLGMGSDGEKTNVSQLCVAASCTTCREQLAYLVISQPVLAFSARHQGVNVLRVPRQHFVAVTDSSLHVHISTS